jgi:hypothetical protein
LESHVRHIIIHSLICRRSSVKPCHAKIYTAFIKKNDLAYIKLRLLIFHPVVFLHVRALLFYRMERLFLSVNLMADSLLQRADSLIPRENASINSLKVISGCSWIFFATMSICVFVTIGFLPLF